MRNLSLDINSVNTIVLLLGVVLHGNIHNFTKATQHAVALCWPIVLMYHIYAGLAGLIQFTPVGGFLVRIFDPILTAYSYPLLIAVISTVVAIFIPTSGGQWAIQGAVTVEAAKLVGVSAQRGLLALSVGDHMGNLITPFWAVVGAGIARVDFRLMFGYRLIFAAFGSRWAFWRLRFCLAERRRRCFDGSRRVLADAVKCSMDTVECWRRAHVAPCVNGPAF